MTLMELFKVLNDGCKVRVYTEREVIYVGAKPADWRFEIPAKYAYYKVVLVTAHELEFSIHIEEA